MNTLNILKKRPRSSLLGLALDGGRMDGVVLRRVNGSLSAGQAFSATLTLDPLTADPELVGRELRNHLDGAGIRERDCVVCLPLKWVLAAHAEIPDLPEEDIASFLQIEAERNFPCDVATLQMATSRCDVATGKKHAFMTGIPRTHLSALEAVLRAARLRPLSFSIGLAALQPPGTKESPGVMALAVGETHVGLQITAGGGVVALRALEGAIEQAGGRRVLHADLVAREARITLGQLAGEIRDSVRRVRIFGPRDLARQLGDEMELRLEAMGLSVEVVGEHAPGEFGLELPRDTAATPELSRAARYLAGWANPFELLPPRVTAWQQVTSKYSSGKLRMAGAAAAVCLLLVLGLFGWQQYQLARYDSRWKAMAAKVKDLDKVQQQIRQFRPWYDDSLRSMAILRRLTESFPEDGVVTAKTIEIREPSSVTCTGTARDVQTLLKTCDKLRACKEISDLKLNQIRGKSPMQFTLDFHWNQGGRSEN